MLFQVITFEKVKVTNNESDNTGQVSYLSFSNLHVSPISYLFVFAVVVRICSCISICFSTLASHMFSQSKSASAFKALSNAVGNIADFWSPFVMKGF